MTFYLPYDLLPTMKQVSFLNSQLPLWYLPVLDLHMWSTHCPTRVDQGYVHRLPPNQVCGVQDPSLCCYYWYNETAWPTQSVLQHGRHSGGTCSPWHPLCWQLVSGKVYYCLR